MQELRYGYFLTTHYCEACQLFLAYQPEKRQPLTWEEMTAPAKTFAKKTIKKWKKEEP